MLAITIEHLLRFFRNVERLLSAAAGDDVVGFLTEAVHGGHHAAGIEFRTQSVHLLAECVARVQALHGESGGQLKKFVRHAAIEGIVLRAEISAPGHVRARLQIQHHIRRHGGMIRTAMFRYNRTKGRVILRFRVRARLVGQIRGLHDHVRFMIAEAAIDGSNEGELVEHRGLLWQILADVRARQFCGDCLEGAANLTRPVHLWIPGVDVRGATGHPQQDHGLVARCGLAFRAQFHQRRQGQAAESREARFQN